VELYFDAVLQVIWILESRTLSCYTLSGQIQIGNDFLQSSFSILEDQPMDMLLGLDMLKRHQVISNYYFIVIYTSNQINVSFSVATTHTYWVFSSHGKCLSASCYLT
jgi:hypothetical protein